ncbi:MAG: sterol desaturase family protein [Beijerinckiaceae bacterium]|nr:sterol desaturase family protein [Beijerinckiaceae bacterium]
MDGLNEPLIRLASFLSVLAIMATYEIAAPRRKLSAPQRLRWLSNLGIVGVNTLVLRLLFPLAGVGFALYASERSWGLGPLLGAPHWLWAIVCVIALDAAIWAQHVMFHHVPALWRLHRMHHADLDIDVTTGLRFHPVEIILSMLIKFVVIALLGAPAIAVLIFEILLNATAMFNHSNVKMPERADALIRTLIVTPDMHRVHHSVDPSETHTNFGFNLSIWDKLAGLYKAQPNLGHDGMSIGLPEFRDPRELRLDKMLMQPLRSDGAGAIKEAM